MAKTFYRTKISFEVLSEDPIPEDMSPEGIIAEGDIGGYVIAHAERQQTELTEKEAADALYDFGSEPSFFQLDCPEGCNGLGWLLSERSDGRYAVECCDLCQIMSDEDAAQAARAAGVECSLEYPCVLLDQTPAGVAAAVQAMNSFEVGEND